MTKRIQDFSDLPKEFKKASKKQKQIAKQKTFDPDSLSDLDPSSRKALASEKYASAKEQFAKGDFALGGSLLLQAARLDSTSWILKRRSELAQDAIDAREPVRWRLSLHELQRRLQVLCMRSRCTCTTHFEIASCLSLLDADFPAVYELAGVLTYTLGEYHAYRKNFRWTKALRRAKGGGAETAEEPYEVFESMADVAADFLLSDASIYQAIDVLVPVPPSAEKFVRRNLLAPNDVVASRISLRLGVPVIPALRRIPGAATREATVAELEEQFVADASHAGRLKGLGVLLVEDIWTWGRTIPACASKLRPFGPMDIRAVALAHSTY